MSWSHGHIARNGKMYHN